MEIEIYKKKAEGVKGNIGIYENEYHARVPVKSSKNYIELKNKDLRYLGSSIAQTIKENHKNKLESLILKRGEGIEGVDISIISREIQNSGSNN